MLGHAALSTTEGYLGVPTLDELAASVEGVSFLPPDGHPAIPLVETVGIEPTKATFGLAEVGASPVVLEDWFGSFHDALAEKVALYAAHFQGLREAEA